MKKKIKDLTFKNLFTDYGSYQICKMKTDRPDSCEGCPLYIGEVSRCVDIISILNKEVELLDFDRYGK